MDAHRRRFVAKLSTRFPLLLMGAMVTLVGITWWQGVAIGLFALWCAAIFLLVLYRTVAEALVVSFCCFTIAILPWLGFGRGVFFIPGCDTPWLPGGPWLDAWLNALDPKLFIPSLVHRILGYAEIPIEIAASLDEGFADVAFYRNSRTIRTFIFAVFWGGSALAAMSGWVPRLVKRLRPKPAQATAPEPAP